MRLRKQGDPEARRLEDIRLHLDDVEHLMELWVQAGLRVTIRDETYEYEALSEVIEKRGIHPQYLEIAASSAEEEDPTIKVELGSTWARLCSAGTADLGSLPFQAENLLRARRSLLVDMFKPGLWLTLLFLAGFLRASGWGLERGGRDIWNSVLVTLAGMATLSVAVRYGYAGLWLRRRHEGGLVKRNTDKLWLLLIGAILGVIAEAVGRLVFGSH